MNFFPFLLVFLFTTHQMAGAEAVFLGRQLESWEYKGWLFERLDKDLQHTREGGDVHIFGYRGPGGSLIVPGSIDGSPVVSVRLGPLPRNYPESGHEREHPVTELRFPGSIATVKSVSLPHLTNVVIEEGVTAIGGKAFTWSTNLQSASIPGSVTNFGDAAFSKLPKLTNVVFGQGLTKIPAMAFAHSGLKSAVLPSGTTEIATAAFYRCLDLTNVFIPGTVKVVWDNSFWGCSNLTSLVIGEGVENIRNSAFRECAKLESVVVPESFKGVASDQFRDCPNLTNVTLPAHLQDFISIEGFGFAAKVEAELLEKSKAAGVYWPKSKTSAP